MVAEKTVKDLMRPLNQYCSIKEDAMIQEAVYIMAKAREGGKHPCLLVVGLDPYEKEVIKGFVTATELVFGCTTRFLKGAEKSGPIFWEGQFGAECLEGVNKRVGEIMAPIRAYVRENDMLMEAVFLLNKYHEDFLPAISREEVIGIIHIGDILSHVTGIISKKRDYRTGMGETECGENAHRSTSETTGI